MDDLAHSKSSTKQSRLPKWLRKIQETSWEAEILISFGALIILFQLPDYLLLLSRSMEKTMGLTIIHTIPVFFIIPIIILGIGFVCHLIIRGFWAGMIAMNFSFPDGINKEKLNWRGRFKEVLKNARENTSVILDLEKLAGIIFGFTFLMFFTTIAIIIWMLVGVILPARITLFLIPHIPKVLLTIVPATIMVSVGIFLLVSLVYLLDFITLGWIKRNKRFSKFYYPFYRILSFITLSNLSKNLYYTLVSNVSKKHLIGGILALILVLFLLVYVSEVEVGGKSQINTKANNFNPNNYGLLEDWEFKTSTRLSGRIIDNGFLEIFWLYNVNVEDTLKAYCFNKNIIADSVNLKDSAPLEQQKCLDKFFRIYLDDTLKIEAHWSFFEYNKRMFPFYIMTSGIDVSMLQNGLHTISIQKGNGKVLEKDKTPFYIAGIKD